MANRRIGRAEIARRRGVVDRWCRSGESAAEFGRRVGISQWALYAWARQTKAGGGRRRRGRKRVDADPPGERQGFVPVQVVPDEHVRPWSRAGGFVEIELHDGAVVRVVGEVSSERVGAVLAAVRQAC